MKTLEFSYRKAVTWALALTVIGAVSIAIVTPNNRLTAALTFTAVMPIIATAVFRALSPIKVCYTKDEVLFRQIASGENRVKWEELEKVDHRKGNQHVFRFGSQCLYLLPYCYENEAWQDFSQHIRIKN